MNTGHNSDQSPGDSDRSHRDSQSSIDEELSIDADFPSRWFDTEALLSDSLAAALIFRRECVSTNDLALKLAAQAEVLPLLIVTDCQTGGRGRGRNTWWAREGSLTFSLLLDPAMYGIDARSWPLISLVTAIAVADTLEEFVPAIPVGLKWPNDVHLAGKKIGGILVEPARQTGQRLVIGIGINILNSLANAPSEIRDLATSIVDETGDRFSPGDFLLANLKHLSRQLHTLGQGQLELQARWARQCTLTGQQITLKSGHHLIEGRCTGIAPDGAILIESSGTVTPWFGGIVRSVQNR